MTDTCTLKGLKSSTIYQITRSYEDIQIAAYVVTTPFFKEIEERWTGDQFHQSIREVVYTKGDNIRLSREFRKWNGFELFDKFLILEIVDTPINPTFYDKVIVNMVEAGSISNENFTDASFRNQYFVLYKDKECRLYTNIKLVDDPSYDRGIRPDIDIYLDIVPYITANDVMPKTPVPTQVKYE